VSEKTEVVAKTADPENPKSGGKQDDPEGFKPITSEADLAAYKDGLRKSIAADVKRQFEEDQTRKEADAKAEQERKDASARGEFKVVEESLTKELNESKATATSLQEKITKYEELTKIRIEAMKKDLPAVAIEKFPDDADPLVQLEWLEDRADMVAKLSPSTGVKPKNPNTPPANGSTGTDVEQAQAKMRGRVSV
jgi:hypothetical protein